MFCKNCGAVIKDNAVFCSECGASVSCGTVTREKAGILDNKYFYLVINSVLTVGAVVSVFVLRMLYKTVFGVYFSLDTLFPGINELPFGLSEPLADFLFSVGNDILSRLVLISFYIVFAALLAVEIILTIKAFMVPGRDTALYSCGATLSITMVHLATANFSSIFILVKTRYDFGYVVMNYPVLETVSMLIGLAAVAAYVVHVNKSSPVTEQTN